MPSVTVRTEIEVYLSDFHTKDLIDELERRGHAVDADCAADLDPNELLRELCRRAYSIDYNRVPLEILIEGLQHYHCPANLMTRLLEWQNEPVPTLKKLENWLATCTT